MNHLIMLSIKGVVWDHARADQEWEGISIIEVKICNHQLRSRRKGMQKFKMCADVICDWYETKKVPSSVSRQNVSAGVRVHADRPVGENERACLGGQAVGHQDSRIETDALNNSLQRRRPR